MKKLLWPATVLLFSGALYGCSVSGNLSSGASEIPPAASQEQGPDLQAEEDAVIRLVQDFGKKLQMVSLLAPADVLENSLQEHFGEFVAPELLARWKAAPEEAPGRTVSSPWPDRIEVLSAERLPDGSYRVQGEIIEITSAEQSKDEAAAKRSVTLEVKLAENRWLISDVKLGDYADNDPSGSAYVNTPYGFQFALPDSWKGYTVVTDKWEGRAAGVSMEEAPMETGPMILIRHPEWTADKPRQDIPILVFTLAQWDALQQEKFHLGAAPVGPSELGRNTEYVFALPARYNYAFPEGYEEVEEILKNNPLKPIAQ
jgi:hypothetical protein